ncbi:zinc-binding dehydrogenase [Actinopolymorpha pittospori]
MRAVLVSRFGGPEVLVPTDVPDPEAGLGEVVVRVAAADTLFVDTQIRRGAWQDYLPVELPYVPGGAVVGTVVSGVGVDPYWIGRDVATRTLGWGGYAEQAVARADDLVPVPDGLDRQQAAALLHDGPTALGLFDAAGVRSGEWVLVTAAAGGMGTVLVQLARSVGAHVVGAARGAPKLDLLRGLGVQGALDYTTAGWAERVRELTGGTGVSAVFDGVGGEIGRTAFDLTADGGRFSQHGAPSGGFAGIDPEEGERRGVSVRGIEQVQFAPERVKALTARALAEAATGRVRPVIGRTFPLERAADAHTAIEDRAVVGKALLVV